MIKIFFLLSSVACSVTGFGQTTISGKVIDSSFHALSFVAVALQQNNKIIASTATNEAGLFEIPATFDHTQKCMIRLSLVGYRTFSKEFVYPDTAFLIPVILAKENNTLNNVTVVSGKPLVTRRSDRYIINVENSFLANGNSAFDVLQRSPGLWVDNNGAIRIRGTQSVTVMINDVVQRMSGDELAEYLKTLRSEDIARIEVIPNPPAEFEASGSGGIVHIILKRAKKDGMNGTISAQYRQQGREPSANTGGSFDYKRGKLYLFGGMSLVKDVNNSFGNSANRFADGSSFSSVGTRHNDNARQNYRLGISYELSGTRSFTIQSSMNGTQMHHTFWNDIVQQTGTATLSGLNTTDWIRKPRQSGTNALYMIKTDSLGSSVKLIADYTSSSREEINTFSGIYNDHSQDGVHINTTPNKTNIYSLQADITKIFSNAWVLRGGIKYAGIKRDNHVTIEDLINGTRVLNTGASNHFIYNEDLAMGYVALEKTIHTTSVKLGLRGEDTWSKGNSLTSNIRFARNYFGLFPSVFITHALNEQKGSAVYASYSRRLERPGFNELNPYRLQLSNVISNIGNPDLLPQYSNNFEAGYQFWKGWSANLYFSVTTGIISQISNPVGNKIENQYLNLDNNTSYGFNIEAPFTVVKGWVMNNSFSLSHASYTIRAFKNGRTSFSVRNIQTISFNNLFDLDLIVAYRSPYANGNAKVSDFFFMDMGFSKKLFKGKARLRLNFTDIFNASREQEKTDYLGTHFEFYQKRQTQNIILGMNYNFSIGKKFNNKKIEQANSEEKNRIGN